LLIVYWAGHGLKSGDRHCLLLANAKQDDFVSYSMENLRLTLSCVECAGFSQQIFLVDTCKTFHGKYYTPPTIQELPVGERTRKNQFQFFACQEGQAAKDSGKDKRGVFTTMLLQTLKETPDLYADWPPDMLRWAGLVQAAFQTEKGMASSTSQYPVYSVHCNVVDWDGNSSSKMFPVLSSCSVEAELSLLQAIKHLARLLADHFGHPRQRDRLVSDFRFCGNMGRDIFVNVQRHPASLHDFEELVTTCVERSEGLALLQKIVLSTIGNSIAKDEIASAFLDIEIMLRKEGLL
ncbi:MAG: caspase family protein, partial [Cyanobacteriota bacterium]